MLGQLARAYQQTPELEAPATAHVGLQQRQQHDDVHRFERLRRKKKLTDSEQHELRRLGQDRVATPVAIFSNDDAA